MADVLDARTTMAKSAVNSVWGTDLSTLHSITNDDVERIAQENVKTPKSSTERGYKFFWGKFVHNIEVRECAVGHDVKARCFASMRKSQLPHYVTLTLGSKVKEAKTVVVVTKYKCSCRAGTGFCQHEIGLLFNLAHYQYLGITKVPEIEDGEEVKDVSSTSKSQKWHVPARTSGFTTRSLTDVQIIAPRRGPGGAMRVDSGVRSKLYNPVTVPLSTLNIPDQLLPTIKSSSRPPQWLQLWSGREELQMVESKFGLVPQGSLLSYQEKILPPAAELGEAEPFSLPNLPPLNIAPDHLSADEKVIMKSLSVTHEESAVFENKTRTQGKCTEWHRLRRNRLTASKFKTITGRRGKFAVLADELLTKRTRKTAAMQRGNDEEDNAAKAYASRYGFKIFPVGFVINPSIPHLGCSPDRRVLDVEADPQWGLLEVKTTAKASVTALSSYLKVTDGNLQLRRTHAHYEQCLGQMALTGAQWCDFYVQAEDDYHCERISFVEADFLKMKEKLDGFFVSFFLPALIKHN